MEQMTNQPRACGEEDRPTQDIMEGICYRLPAQSNEVDEAFFREMEEIL